MTKDKRYARSEFRYNYYTKHPNYVFEESGNNYKSVGITHKKYTRLNKKWHKNMPLKQNPQKNKADSSFARFGVITQNKNTYSSVQKNFRFSKTDMANVKAKIRNYKNYRRKK